MMFLPRLYARLCARNAGRTLLAHRISKNYSQFMQCPEAEIPADFLQHTIYEQGGFSFIEQIFPPCIWRKNVRFDLHQRVEAFTHEHNFYHVQRTLLLGMQWSGFSLILDALLATAPQDVRFQFITRHPALQKLLTAQSERRASGFFAAQRLVTVLLMDERLPDAPLFSTKVGDQRVWLTDVPERLLTRYGTAIRTLQPGCSLHSTDFTLESQHFPETEYRQAATVALGALRKMPTLWSAWDDLSVIYHG